MRESKYTTPQRMVYDFGLVILLGGLILSLPICSAEYTFTPFADSLFTSATSVCVTGLVTVTTATHWNLLGKLVILCLIQLGGWGVITAACLILKLTGEKLMLRDRMILQESYGLNSLEEAGQFFLKVVRGSLGAEALGAFGYAFVFVPEFGWVKGIWYSVFHSVSAFCNAGLDILGENSLMNYQSNVLVMLVTSALIVFGGLGFLVWWDIFGHIRERMQIRRDFRNQRRRAKMRPFMEDLTVQSRLVIVCTLGLLLSGTVFIFILEYSNPGTIGNLPLPEKLLASFFESVTLRTAGFAAVDQSALRVNTCLVAMVYMVIGGSPAGTAGGFKTTTAAVLWLTVASVITGRPDVELYRRRVSPDVVRNAITITFIVIAIALSGVIALSITEDASLTDIAFEVFSAVGTVGLSRNLTPTLSTIGKYIIIWIMFSGRIGPVTMVMAFRMHQKSKVKAAYPEVNIMIG